MIVASQTRQENHFCGTSQTNNKNNGEFKMSKILWGLAFIVLFIFLGPIGLGIWFIILIITLLSSSNKANKDIAAQLKKNNR